VRATVWVGGACHSLSVLQVMVVWIGEASRLCGAWLCGVGAGRQAWQLLETKELVLELLPAVKAASDSASEAELLALTQ
jgi:hypothetical protein